jgi:hypothetical protein
LRLIQTSTVQEIRYVDGRAATLRWGTGHGAGAIVVTTRH